MLFTERKKTSHNYDVGKIYPTKQILYKINSLMNCIIVTKLKNQTSSTVNGFSHCFCFIFSEINLNNECILIRMNEEKRNWMIEICNKTEREREGEREKNLIINTEKKILWIFKSLLGIDSVIESDLFGLKEYTRSLIYVWLMFRELLWVFLCA